MNKTQKLLSKKLLVAQSVVIVSSLAMLLAINGCVDRKAQAESKQTEKFLDSKTIAVEVIPAAGETVLDSVAVTGNLTTSMITQVGARQQGRVTAVNVKDGDTVTAGEVIAQQDPTQMRASLEQAFAQEKVANSALTQAISNEKYQPIRSQAAVNQAQSQVTSAEAALKKELAGAREEERKQAAASLASAKTNLQVAQANLKRQENLFDQGAIPQNQLDTARNQEASAQQQYDNALQNVIEIRRGNRPEDIAVAQQAVVQAKQNLKSAIASQHLDVLLKDQVQSAKDQLSVAKAQVALAQANLNDLTIRAPFSGQVSGQPIQVGTVCSIGTSIAQLVSTEGTYFDAQVPEQYISKVKPGNPVVVTIDALPGETFSGHVKAINPVGAEYGRLFSVRISVDSKSNELKPNMFATGKIQLASTANSTVVPANAILTNGAESFVYTVQNGIAKKLDVKTGIRSEKGVQVIGLAVGTPIVVQGQGDLHDGSEVQVTHNSAI